MNRGARLLLTLGAIACAIVNCHPQNMTIISTSGRVLSIQQTNCTSKVFCSHEDNLWMKNVSVLFSPWKEWSHCKKNHNGSLVQLRERTCKYHDICNKATLKQEKPCQRKKKKRRKKNKWKLRRDSDSEQPFHVVAIPSMLSIKHLGTDLVYSSGRSGTSTIEKRVYSKWSRWTMCTQSCLTQRYRWCKKVEMCGNDVIRQTAFCYTEGSHCETWIQNKFALEEEKNYQSTSESTQEFQNFEPQTSNAVELQSVTEGSPAAQIGPPEQWSTCGVATNISYHSYHQANMLRIIGGRPTQNGKWPWIVAVLNRFREAFCGGTLVSPRWVLTAAHCVRKRLYVTIGEYNLNQREEKELRLRVKKSVIHPKYNIETVDNDLALLYLPIPVPQDTHPGIACLPKPKDHLPIKRMCTIVGWGKRRASDQYGTDILHEAQVPIVTNQACREVYTDYQITGNMFCAGYRRGRMDSCSGDSGGPLLCPDDHGRWTIFGITSFGEGCGKKGKYGIYTRLPNYVRWIQRVVNS